MFKRQLALQRLLRCFYLTEGVLLRTYFVSLKVVEFNHMDTENNLWQNFLRGN